MCKVWNTPSLPLLPDERWRGIVVTLGIPSTDQIVVSENYSYLIGPWVKKKKFNPMKQQHKKCKYEIAMNAIPSTLGMK